MLCDRRAPRMRALLAITLLAAAILGAAPARAADGAVLLRVRLWTTPNHAARGDVVKYEIMVDNAGDARASRVRVTLPFSKHMQVVRAQFDHQATWVSALGEDELTVMFGRLPGGESRRAQIFFTIGQDAPDGLQVRVRATARHERDAGHGEKSNYTTLTIGGQEADTRP
ncbi:MAG TPA: hypothetical protein VNL77_17310, partial [Roseiflexaceae bacterium]|nr:hypothetical protein [Roseiflexaceae bacterium]